MKTAAFIISKKENEKRRALMPFHIKNIKNKSQIFVEKGYGKVFGFTDNDYKKMGVNICSREEALSKDIIIDPKIGDAPFLNKLENNKTLFGWMHLVQNKDLTDLCIEKHFSVYCWENMFENNIHVFHRNNQIAGEAAVMHAFECCGRMPEGLNVAVLGNGNVASGAIKTLKALNANVTVYEKKDEKKFQREFFNYDVLVNAILWDTNRKDHIIYKKDMYKMKKNSLLIDISCDHDGGFESSHPTTIKKPIYKYAGVYHYAVDHVPSLFFYDSSASISEEVTKYIDQLLEENPNEVLINSLGISNAKIIDKKILIHQNR